MTLRWLRLILAAGVLTSGSVAPAQAPGAPRPAYSPYLNLARPGNAANNYYGLVRPEIEFRNSISGLQTQYGALSQEVHNPITAETPLPATGHKTYFMSYSHYFNQ